MKSWWVDKVNVDQQNAVTTAYAKWRQSWPMLLHLRNSMAGAVCCKRRTYCPLQGVAFFVHSLLLFLVGLSTGHRLLWRLQVSKVCKCAQRQTWLYRWVAVLIVRSFTCWCFSWWIDRRGGRPCPLFSSVTGGFLWCKCKQLNECHHESTFSVHRHTTSLLLLHSLSFTKALAQVFSQFCRYRVRT